MNRMPISSRSPFWAAGLFLAALALAGCQEERPAVRQNPLYLRLSDASAKVDTAAAASLFNDYRRSDGLADVSVDPALNTFAERQLDLVAGRDSLAIPGGQPVTKRLAAAGIRAETARENVSAGYYTLSDAFSGWRGSPPNDATLRLAGARRMGLATRGVPGSKYGVYWVLVMAGP